MLQDFEYMSNGHLGRVGVDKHYVTLTSTDIQLLNSAAYLAYSKARK